MKRKLGNYLIIGLLILSVVPICFAGGVPSQSPVVNLNSVLVDVFVLPNGRINVTYWIEITVESGSLGGFDLRGIQETRIWDPDRAYAQVGEEKYNLLVTTYWDGYGLDWVPRTQEGETVTVVFGYFSTERVIEKTTSETYGDLGVFNWAPVQWEIPIDYEAVQVIYPIVMNSTWIEPSHGITPEGAEYAGYVVDDNQGLWDGGTQYSFDVNNLLAYPYDAGAATRNFTVSLEHNNLDAYTHFRVWHYTNWSFYEPFLQAGALGYSAVSYVNANAETEFDLQVAIYNFGDADLEEVIITMSLPENLTLTSGSVTTYVGDLTGGETWYQVYS
ncbi:MAG: hypothetical protein ACFFEW_16005, partial [Candidatus Thorarchaeota archaeon]